MKKLIICCDGTWNTPDQSGSATNVVKIARAIDPTDSTGIPQIVAYFEGVGTTEPLKDLITPSMPAWKRGFLSAVDRIFYRFPRLIGGAFGVGLSETVKNAYSFLVNNYEPGDDIYLFGFSRGAYAARSLAGLIRNSGVLQKQFADQLDNAYSLYRSRDANDHPDASNAQAFVTQFSQQVPIRFIGVWDTVGALGFPNSLGIPGVIFNFLFNDLFRFHDMKLSSQIDYAYQALALDEQRPDFQPCIWIQSANNPNQILEQVWFAGVHADVGGGYANTGLSDCTLAWMIGKATTTGLAINPGYAGYQSIQATPNPAASIHDSMTGMFALSKTFLADLGLVKKPQPRTAVSTSTERISRCVSLRVEYKPVASIAITSLPITSTPTCP